MMIATVETERETVVYGDGVKLGHVRFSGGIYTVYGATGARLPHIRTSRQTAIADVVAAATAVPTAA